MDSVAGAWFIPFIQYGWCMIYMDLMYLVKPVSPVCGLLTIVRVGRLVNGKLCKIHGYDSKINDKDSRVCTMLATTHLWSVDSKSVSARQVIHT